MTDNDKDSGSVGGTTGQPSQGGSGQQSDQPHSFDAAKLQTTLDALAHKVEEIDARSKSLQGDKDRDVKKTRREVEEIKRMFAEVEGLQKRGLDVDAAAEEYDFRETVRQLKDQLGHLPQAQTQSAGNAPSLAEEQARVAKEIGLDLNTVEGVQLLAQSYPDVTHFEAAAAKVKLRQVTQQPPGISSVPAQQGGNSQRAVADRESLKRDYSEQMEKFRGNKMRLRQIQQEFKQKGLDVENIGFGVTAMSPSDFRSAK